MLDFDVIVIGGGASGLMCALTAGQRGRKVLVIEHTRKVGKKILMSGGGRCNFTNMDVSAKNFISNNPHFCKSALSEYSHWDFIGLVCQHGIDYHERDHGQLFCDDSSKQILRMLTDECAKGNVEIATRCEVSEVTHDGHYLLETSLGPLSCESLVLATGGLSIPSMGTTDFGQRIAQQFGMSLLPCSAGLVPFTFSDKIKGVCERLSGIATPATLSLAGKGRESFHENILFTHRGLSGPVALQLSNYWNSGESIYMDILPSQQAEEYLLELKRDHGRSLLRNLLAKDLVKSLVSELETLWWPQHAQTPMSEMPDKLLRKIAHNLNNWELKPSGTEGYRTAEVTRGGIDTKDLSSKTMQSTLQAGLFCIGEVVDVTGWLGGYNFQWAWSSGVAAGKVA